MARLPIVDEFTTLPVSRQMKYQLRMARDKRCAICGGAAVSGARCLGHMVKNRERMRKRMGFRRRYHNKLSYVLEDAAATLLRPAKTKKKSKVVRSK